MLTTAAVCAALLAAGWRWDASGALTNTPADHAYCIGCGRFVPQAAFAAWLQRCETCRMMQQAPVWRLAVTPCGWCAQLMTAHGGQYAAWRQGELFGGLETDDRTD